MPTFVGSEDVSPTGIRSIDNLLWGSRWQIENDRNRLTYSFSNDRVWDRNTIDAEEVAFHNAMQSWSNVANFQLDFSGYNDRDAEIIFHSVDADFFPTEDILGQAIPPGELNFLPYVPGDVQINRQEYIANPTFELAVGSYDYLTFVHEIGHALGLAHPHDGGGDSSIHFGVDHPQDSGEYGLNQFIWTIMSYVAINSDYSPGQIANWGYIGGPMAFDIAAVQYLYGPNLTHNTGNNTYHLPTTNGLGTYWSSIWDAGGVDTISGITATNAVTINLNNASLANGDPNAGGYISRVDGIIGGFTIANSQGGYGVIENATGSRFSDRLTGNEYNNSISGVGGNDTLLGGSGDDTLLGGSGDDYLVGYSGGSEFDVLTGGGGIDTFVLGNSSRSFYQGEGYALITDFDWESDFVQVWGTSNQYSLVVGDFLGGIAQDTAVLFGDDLIGVIQDSTNVNFARDFLFV